MEKITLVIMAAGIGSRYGGLKQIDSFGPSGEIILDYSVFDAIRAGFDKVVFIIRKDIEDVFKEKIGNAIEKQIETHYVFQELTDLPNGFSVPADRKKPWGTSHAVLCAKNAVREPFAVINADDFYGQSAFEVLAGFLKNAQDRTPQEYAMVGYILGNTLTDYGHVARGVCVDDGCGNLQSIIERTKIKKFADGVKYTEDDEKTWAPIDAQSLVSMNMWGFTKGFMKELETRFPDFLRAHGAELKSEYLVPSTVNKMVQEGSAKVKVLSTDARWFGVTYQEDKPMVKAGINALVEKGNYPGQLWT